MMPFPADRAVGGVGTPAMTTKSNGQDGRGASDGPALRPWPHALGRSEHGDTDHRPAGSTPE